MANEAKTSAIFRNMLRGKGYYDDKDIVAAMKRGSRMIINGTSFKGTKTKDTYSLSGFTSAYKAISNKCK